LRRIRSVLDQHRGDVLALGVLLASSVALMWDAIFRDRVLYWGTAILQFQPWHQMVADALKSGSVPLWTHSVGNGAPLLANLQSAVLYPPNLLYLALPAYRAMSLLMAAHVALAGCFAYLLARYLGMRPVAALVAGLSYGLAGFFVARSQFASMTSAYPWLPLSVLLLERLIRRPSLRRAAWLALALAAFLCAGHAQMWYYALLLLGTYALWRGWAGPSVRASRGARARIAPVAWLALAVALALLLSAAQVLPTAELMQHSQRLGGPDFEYATTYSFWPWHFLTFLAPDLFGNPASGDYWGYANYWEDCGYVGVLPLALALYAVYRRVRRGRGGDGRPPTMEWLVPFLSAVALLSLALALGSHSPLFMAAYKWFPGVRWFQAPARFLFLYTFAVSVLAGYGAELLVPSKAWVRRGRLAAVGSIGAIFIALALRLGLPGVEVTFAGAMLRLAVTVAVIGLWLAFSLGRRSGTSRALWRWAGIALIAVDLLTFGRPLVPTAPASGYSGQVELVGVLEPSGEPYRILTTESYEYNTMFSHYTRFADFGAQNEEVVRELRATLLPNLCAMEGLETASNYDPLLDARYLAFRRAAEAADGEAQQRLLAEMNVRYLVSRKPSLDTEPVWDKPGIAVEENGAVYPRVRFAPQATQVADSGQWERILESGELSPDHVWLEEAPMTVHGEASGSAIIAWDASWNAISVGAELPTPGYVVVSETYHPGWRAWDNGEPVRVLRGDYAFMAIPIAEAGSHDIELQFRPASWTVGCLVSGLALAAVLVAVAWPRRRGAGLP